MKLIHPGEHLKEMLEELGLSQSAFAQSIGVSPMRISHLVKGNRPVTAELAILFGRSSRRYNATASERLKTASSMVLPKLATSTLRH
jgi:addiction module HigA family antidote